MAQARQPPRPRRSTKVGYGAPGQEGEWEDDEETAVDGVRPIAAPVPVRRAGTSVRPPAPDDPVAPPVEVFLVHHDPSTASRAYPWRALEIWTRNRVYICDSAFRCIEVLNRASGRAEPDHAFIRANLTGGQRRDGSTLELSQPLPLPGTEAVFRHDDKRRARFGQTSKVERVVLRIHVLNASLVAGGPALEELSDRFALPEVRARR